MEQILDYVKFILAFAGGIIGWIFGGFDSLIYALIAFVTIDYITGILLAIRDKKVSSDIGFKGIVKKFLIFLIVSMGNIIDYYILGTGTTLRTLIIMFYLSNEGISILENAGQLGLPIPKKLKSAIQKLNDNNE
ncbi:toxin secretion/phage lysis holin [Anaerocolumna jejuensis DSM 15929]|uniref:Toxin secretion/phage lysis holin n=1 Tax=Anaerocolumna jejuensis DSM 15929 TaxID=1121322 RepID=A0A1M6Q029_9FIRM|nr:phage holin family protein [Anaerocolumna jejuensis]SHK13511.1 toxin secretion/phage lysis holin [Anaerocolumna jejuensis DSM 15929]